MTRVRSARPPRRLIAQGADVLCQNTDSPAVVQTAEKKGVYAFGWDSDMSRYGPRAQLTANTQHWGVYYVEEVRKALNKTWTGNRQTKWGIKENMVVFAPLSKAIPADVAKLFEERKQAIAAGTLDPFTGPIKDNTGKPRVAAGATLPFEQVMSINWYVEGVEGSISEIESGMSHTSLRTVLPLALATGTSMLATDLYLPAVPVLQKSLGVDVTAGQATVATFYAGLALSQLAWGESLNRIGPRRCMLVGISALIVTSVGCALATSLSWLLALRFIQGIAAGAATIVAPSVVRSTSLGATPSEASLRSRWWKRSCPPPARCWGRPFWFT